MNPICECGEPSSTHECPDTAINYKVIAEALRSMIREAEDTYDYSVCIVRCPVCRRAHRAGWPYELMFTPDDVGPCEVCEFLRT